MDDDVARLARENRVLTRKLQRALDALARVEDQREATRRLHASTMAQMQEAERELIAKNDALAAATSAKSVFLAHMSHELRTPLNAVIGYTELLLDDPQVAKHSHGELEAILRASRGLVEVLSGILDLTQIETGHLELEKEPFTVRELLANVLAAVDLTSGRLAFHVDLTFPEDTILVGDELRLRQVMINLVSNALKFTLAGEVRLHVAAHDHAYQFTVSDTGIGMSQEVLTRIFQPFVQADGSTTRRFGGSGLGLAICWRLIQQMGGTLTVTSEEGVGTTFTLTIPDLVRTGPTTAA